MKSWEGRSSWFWNVRQPQARRRTDGRSMLVFVGQGSFRRHKATVVGLEIGLKKSAHLVRPLTQLARGQSRSNSGPCIPFILP